MVNAKKAQVMPSAMMPVRPVRVSAAKPAQPAQPAKGPAAIAVLVLLLVFGLSIYFVAPLMEGKGTVEIEESTAAEAGQPVTPQITQPKIASTAKTPVKGNIADKFEWAEALGCGSSYPKSDSTVRYCLDELYDDVKLSKSDVMTFNPWLATRSDLTGMNSDGQENRYADYLWSVKLDYVSYTCGDYCVGNTPSKCVGATVMRGDNNCAIIGCTTTCWGHYSGSYSGTDCGYSTEDTCLGSTWHRSDIPVLPG